MQLVAEDVTSSKALAVKTGLTPGSIDTLLQAAAKTLGTQSRKTAAARYVELRENSQTTSQLSLSGLSNPADTPSAHPISTVRSVAQAIGEFLRGPPLGGEKHSLRWDQIMIRIFWVALIGMVTITALVLFVIGFLRTFS